MKQSKQIKYTRELLSSIIRGILDGKYAIPKFRRDYVWNKEKIISFLNSLLAKEPFGFTIIWKNSDLNFTSERSEIITMLSNNDDKKKEYKKECHYIIDGQQRLTSLLLLFKNKSFIDKVEKNKKNKQFGSIKRILNSIYYNVNNEIFESVSSSCVKKHHFKISDVIYDIDEFYQTKLREVLNKKMNNDSNNCEDIYEKIVNINDTLRHYTDVGSIELDGFDIDEAIDVFNNINTKGKKLTLFEIIYSKWLSADIDLLTEFSDIKQYAEEKKLGELDDQIPLDALFLLIDENKKIVAGKDKIEFDVKSKQEHIKNILYKFRKSFMYACDFLKEKHFNNRTIPSKTIIKWMTYLFFKNNNTRLSKNQSDLILQYIYLISINSVYSKATNNQLIDDTKFIDDLLKNKDNEYKMPKPYFDLKKTKIEPNEIIDLKYGDNSMIANFVKHILYCNSIDLKTGSAIKDIDDSYDMHHLFPKGAMDEAKSRTYEKIYNEINSFANLMIIHTDTNNSDIKNKQPKIYYSELLKENDNLDEALEKCFIDVEYFKNNDFDNFLENRAKKITQYINDKYVPQDLDDNN